MLRIWYHNDPLKWAKGDSRNNFTPDTADMCTNCDSMYNEDTNVIPG